MASSKKLLGSVTSLAVEVALYGVLVAVYVLLVLRFLGGWLRFLFDDHRVIYGLVALALIIGQGAALESLTAALLRWFQRRHD